MVGDAGSPVPGGLAELILGLVLVLPLTAALWLFHLYVRVLPEPAVLGAWLVSAALIGRALWWRARARRRILLRAWLTAGSPLVTRLRGGWLLALRQSALALVLAAILLAGLARIEDFRTWILLMLNAPLMLLVLLRVRTALAAHANPSALPLLGWRMTLWICGALLLCALVLAALDRHHPDFSEVTLEQAVWHMMDREHARSPIAETALRVAAAKDGLRLWLAVQWMPQPGVSLVQLAGWALVLLEQLLFVGAWLLASKGVLIGVYRDERIDRSRPA